MVPVSDGEVFLSLLRTQRKSLSKVISDLLSVHIISTDRGQFSADCRRYPLANSQFFHRLPGVTRQIPSGFSLPVIGQSLRVTQAAGSPLEMAWSVGTALKLPGCFEGVLDGTAGGQGAKPASPRVMLTACSDDYTTSCSTALIRPPWRRSTPACSGSRSPTEATTGWWLPPTTPHQAWPSSSLRTTGRPHGLIPLSPSSSTWT